MVWIILLAILIVSYYFIIKSNSKITEKYFSLLSLVFAALTILPILSESFSFILKLSFFLPFVFGVLGIVLGWLGIKGDLRISLIGLNVLALGFYFIVFLMATVGFQEP
ncbi:MULTISPECIES: hypothetical protein [Bacillaceae]|uniref:hypothetical protein n=1 Tax=Bacillaceae TaxID=186817 RepID=UPI000621B3A1|nr:MULTISPECIES: hypothetical protein [Bacillaceae]KKE80744.1 hypothetical protein WH51_00170 [Bacilli bacterium VT-13-104]PZD83117.1 hypothetical protein DEJ64_16045 [Bacilli bacterium]MED4473812.1 hypothetical protein [Oceanobacillus caeni]PZD84128.1 hypothetical protein DEJ60_15355 [Bacilli bacterium]PZD86203.1 hypothetical protein DEJ66_15845 [Bacilli bacterium]